MVQCTLRCARPERRLWIFGWAWLDYWLLVVCELCGGNRQMNAARSREGYGYKWEPETRDGHQRVKTWVSLNGYSDTKTIFKYLV